MRTIPLQESLRVEFKSDVKKLADDELVAAIVCLTNTEGGELYIGVEDDGTITGLHPLHRNSTTLAAMIANGTNPPVSVRCTVIVEDGLAVARVEVPKSHQLVSTSKGLLQRRRIQGNGKPECVPFYPTEFMSRQSDLGLVDYSALPVVGATVADFDPRERLRQLVVKYGGDRPLLTLSDDELDGALGLVQREQGSIVPTITGLLLLGREAALRQHIPTHELGLQVLRGTDVKFNEFYRRPLLWIFERVINQFTVRNMEDEMQFGLFRVPIPDYDLRAFREAFVNALVHRDYARLNASYIQWKDEGISIANPGGFVAGVTVATILVTEPRPRNPYLADAFKRIGLSERTGRGVDLIYQGMLRYGRPAPNYNRSTIDSVTIELIGGKADLGLLRLILEEEQRMHISERPVDTLIALNLLRRERRIDTAALAQAMQRDQSAARTVFEHLCEAGIIVARGVKKGRTYTLSAHVYRALGLSEAYVRQAGFDDIQQEQMVLQFVQVHTTITRNQVEELCHISEDQAFRLLRKLVDQGHLMKSGQGKATTYVKSDEAVKE